ncbi:type II toxin-antitoxin system HicB family antitoxin [Aestuariispira insulae]|uniref:Putative HicB family RNase H-like nuclease n=1 Tax=Aestuariispira insulae TaxID=1461337 RepID=A0A3D9H3S1_9PROT|nr:type II toxin-antitoxin system HicB family antitoxin [Aestuariispira insulae]RED44129.1 putative HicB family RNase H-like nuclease [Aestuariispira insulae]
MLEYKGYVGVVEYEPDDKAFHGKVVGLTSDGIHFQGSTADEVETAFQESVDDYLDWCEQDGIEPDRSYSGSIALRVDPAFHRKAVIQAAAEGVSISRWIEHQIEIA